MVNINQPIRGFQSCTRILVVDDECFNLKGMQVILSLSIKKLGHSQELIDCITDYESSGDQAMKRVKALKQEGKRYGLVITDCSMPRMNGYELSTNIRKFHS